MFTHEDLAAVRTIDLTTFGRKTGQPRRVEIWWFAVGGRLIITGTPGRRDWLANVRANPRVVIGVNGVEIQATAREVEDPEFRELVFTQRETRWYSTQSELRRLVETAPMIEIVVDDVGQSPPTDGGMQVELI